MNRQFTQAAVAIIGMTGLVTGMIITLLVPDLADARNLLLGGLIASTSTAAAWLFRLNGKNGGHTPS
jgi:hypothetical protein